MAKSLNLTQVADLSPLRLPKRYNYIAAFLTLACNLRCSYCINWFGGKGGHRKTMPGADWVRGLNRLMSRPDLPITLQGGEPSLHPGFYLILRKLRTDLPIDILTNLQFDPERFMAEVPPERLRRDAPYASIRVSYHPEVMDLQETKAKVLRLLEAGYSIGIWSVVHPSQQDVIRRAAEECRRAGIDFRMKEFLGVHERKLHGTYKYSEALSGNVGPTVRCRTSELLIGPSGHIYRCHSDLYAGRSPIGHILDRELQIKDIYRSCTCFGLCNPCDVKVKTNRFQKFGHTSVDIRAKE